MNGSDGQDARAAAVALRYDEHGREAARAWSPRAMVWSPMQSSRAPREAGVYVHDSPTLLNLLMQVDTDAQIPPELYVAVAELLARLYQLERT